MEATHPNDKQYQRLKADVKNEIVQLLVKLKKFDAKQKLQPKNGGFAGSMGHIKDELKNINEFLGE